MSQSFHDACKSGQVVLIRSLLQQDANLLSAKLEDYFPIQRTIPGLPYALKCLLEQGDDANRPLSHIHWFEWESRAAEKGLGHWLPIHMAAIHGYHENSGTCLETLVEFGANINSISPMEGMMPIHLAAIPDMHGNVRKLVALGADVDSRTLPKSDVEVDWGEMMDRSFFAPFAGRNETPLMIACGEGGLETVRCLIELNADVNAENENGFTPLHYAAGGFWQQQRDSYLQMVELLLQKGADKCATDSLGRRPIELAESKGYNEIVDRLK